KAWARVYAHFHDKNVVYGLIERLKGNIDDSVYTKVMGMEFDPDLKESRDGKTLDRSKDKLYIRMDIGIGLNDYGLINGGKGCHIDLPQRLTSGLIYLTDQSDLDGGEFQINDPITKEVVKK